MAKRRAKFPTSSYKLGQDGLRFDDGYPDIEDISRHLRFDSTSGSVWQNDQQVLVLPTSFYETLRLQLIDSLGRDEARKVYTTHGYKTGQIDAVRASQLRGTDNLHSIIAAGPQLVALKGAGLVDPLAFRVDFAEGKLHVEAALIGSVEADVHIQEFGVGADPACWWMVGHASGFFSWYMGKPVLFRESQCRAIGSARCLMVGKPLDDYDDAQNEVKYFNVPDFINYSSTKKSKRRVARQWVDRTDEIVKGSPNGEPVSGASPGFKVAMEMLQKVAKTNATVLFIGRTGVGKEFFAHTLHRLSDRADQPLVAVNCAAVPDDLLESELFGVERGAYTGATVARPGRFERADGGVLFLDEVSSLSLPAQGKLLRALQEGQVERLGGTQTINIDVRIVAATNVDLREEVKAKRFREDLFYRLNIFPIHIPPLRRRREDIPLLMGVFLQKYSRAHNRTPRGFSEDAVEALLSYDWPGNIRELENMIERAVILTPTDELIQTSHLFTSGEHLPERIYSVDRDGRLSSSSPLEINWDDLAFRVLESEQESPLLDFENALIGIAMEKSNGNVSAAASILGMTRGQLDYRLKRRASS